MDQSQFLILASNFLNLKMYPYFDAVHYIIMCYSVREDGISRDGKEFCRTNPIASLVSSILMCLAGSILGNFLIGESLVVPFKNDRDLILIFVIWYLVNYSPLDIVYKLCSLSVIKLLLQCAWQIYLINKIHHGVSYGVKHYPKAYLVIVIIGLVKGAGFQFMRIVERLVRGVWNPLTNELLQPSFHTKTCLIASIIFLLHHYNLITTHFSVVYVSLVAFFIYFKITDILSGGHFDPFIPVENFICKIFFGGLVDGFRSDKNIPTDAYTDTN